MNQNETLSEIFEYYSKQANPTQQENLVAMLREIQDLLGCVPKGIQEQAAQAVGTKTGVLSLLVQRFSGLKSADYQHRIIVCNGQRCSSKKAREVLSVLQKELKPDKEGISQDRKVLLCTQNCLKQCTKGANLLLDGVLYSNMDTEKTKKLLKELQ